MVENDESVADASVGPEPLRCPACRYDLRGQAEPRCPECGEEFESMEAVAGLRPDPIRDARAFLVYARVLVWVVAAAILAQAAGSLRFWLAGTMKTLYEAQTVNGLCSWVACGQLPVTAVFFIRGCVLLIKLDADAHRGLPEVRQLMRRVCFAQATLVILFVHPFIVAPFLL
jgi:hypothetical protein